MRKWAKLWRKENEVLRIWLQEQCSQDFELMNGGNKLECQSFPT
jgi:hypothetical protein